MKTHLSRTSAGLLAGVLTASLLLSEPSALYGQRVRADEAAESISCTTDSGSNLGRHDYIQNWTPLTYSYLHPLAEGSWMRVQYVFETGVVIEYYSPDFQLAGRKTVSPELPEFGTFYAASDGNYYLITGDEQDSVSRQFPMFDIAQYNADWELLAHVQTPADDVITAFRAGTVRCADDGKHLLIHTSREMESGHQSNYTIEADLQRMEITDERIAQNRSSGYVSHSFNQFVLLDGTSMVTLDHGDYHPRTVVLQKYPTDYTTGQFHIEDETLDVVNIVKYSPIGDVNVKDMSIMNYTGVSVGGFVQSSTHYLAAYNTIDQTLWREYIDNRKNGRTEPVRNVMIAAVPKDSLQDESLKTTAVTAYSDEDGSGGNPFLVQVAADRFILLWEHGEKVCYVFLDGAGEIIGEQYTMNAALSDCEPVVSGNKLCWYTWSNSEIRFYTIDLEHPEQTENILHRSGHDFQLTEEPDEEGYLYDICVKCGHREKRVIPTSYTAIIQRVKREPFKVSISNINTNEYYFDTDAEFTYTVLWTTPDEYKYQEGSFIEEITEGSEYVRHEPGSMSFFINDFDEDEISFKMKLYPRENPSLSQEFTIHAMHRYELAELTEPNGEQDGSVTFRCAGCGHTRTESIKPLTVLSGGTAEETLQEDTFEYDHAPHCPAVSLLLTDPEAGTTTELQQGTDFTVRYANNVNAGTAYAVLTAAEDSTAISGSLIIPFTITPQQLSDCGYSKIHTFSDPEKPETDLMDALTPKFSLYDQQGEWLPEDAYYTKVMFHFTEDGQHLKTVEYTIHAHHQNYVNSKTIRVPFQLLDIQDYEASFADPELEEGKTLEYTGEPLEPEVVLQTSKGRVLKPGADYAVTYQNNTKPGKATVTISGLICYTGDITLEFTIADKNSQPLPASGDADGDGILSESDAVLFGSWLGGSQETAISDWAAADMNLDQQLDAIDLTLMKRAVLEQPAVSEQEE